MKTIFKFSVLAVLLAVAPSPCLADMGITLVSKERAKELGLQMRFTANGTNEVWVELEFKTEGQLKDFFHVSLEVGDVVGYAPLREERSSSGRVVVRFRANRGSLDKITLRVVVGHPLNYTGYFLRVKDFVEPEKVR